MVDYEAMEDHEICEQFKEKMCGSCPSELVCHSKELNHDAIMDCLTTHFNEIKKDQYPIRFSTPKITDEIFCEEIADIVVLHRLLD
jgi:hypothetical protein